MEKSISDDHRMMVSFPFFWIKGYMYADQDNFYINMPCIKWYIFPSGSFKDTILLRSISDVQVRQSSARRLLYAGAFLLLVAFFKFQELNYAFFGISRFALFALLIGAFLICCGLRETLVVTHDGGRNTVVIVSIFEKNKLIKIKDELTHSAADAQAQSLKSSSNVNNQNRRFTATEAASQNTNPAVNPAQQRLLNHKPPTTVILPAGFKLSPNDLSKESDISDNVPRNNINLKEFKICPWCHTKNRTDAVYCVQCGGPMSGHSKDMVILDKTNKIDKYCIYCGVRNRCSAEFCDHCGASMR